MKQILNQKLSSTDILNIFIERHKLLSPFDPEADPYAELNSNSTIKDWRDANDLVEWERLYPFYNQEFEINATHEEWEAVLVPASKKNLKGVCELIAKHTSQRDIESIKLLGSECLEAGVFKRFKEDLEKEKVDTTNIKPSSLLSDYLDKYLVEITSEVIFLTKGKKVIEKIEMKRKKKGFLNYINIFDKDRFIYSIPNIKTFRDLILKIIEIDKVNIIA